MKFRNDRPIYTQIEEYIRENILKEEWLPENRIPSIRDMAVEMEVNPNTVMRAYSELQDQGIIYNKRGIGYFIAKEALAEIMECEKEHFMEQQLPNLFDKMRLLDIDFAEIKDHYRKYQLKGDSNEINK